MREVLGKHEECEWLEWAGAVLMPRMHRLVLEEKRIAEEKVAAEAREKEAAEKAEREAAKRREAEEAAAAREEELRLRRATLIADFQNKRIGREEFKTQMEALVPPTMVVESEGEEEVPTRTDASSNAVVDKLRARKQRAKEVRESESEVSVDARLPAPKSLRKRKSSDGGEQLSSLRAVTGKVSDLVTHHSF